MVSVVMSLSMPRVRMLNADDVGLAKTIEAGLIITEAMEALKTQANTMGETTAKAQDKVIEVDELEDILAKGWIFISNVGEGRCMVRKMKG